MVAKKSGKKNQNSRVVRGKARASLGIAQPPRRGMVIVHGGGDIAEGYHEGLVAGVRAQLGKPFAFIPAYYSDVITQRAKSIAPRVVSPDEAKFRAAFEKQLREAHARTQADNQARGIATASFLGIDGAIFDTIKEVVVYLFDPDPAQKIQARVIAALDQAAAEFDEIVLVAHSLGTVVAFDALKQFAPRYKIAAWFTLGCPLGKLVKTRVRTSDLGAIPAGPIARWHNLYDTNDIVADVIGSFLHTPAFRIHDIFVEVAPTMPGAHDYFLNPETHAILADALK